jgi:hypothetical protein
MRIETLFGVRPWMFLLAGLLVGDVNAMIIGDFDHDCDVDATDFGHFKLCALGPAVPQADPACADARLDADQDVDLDDFGAFQRCYSGEGNPADPSCAGGVCCPCGQTNCDGTCTNTASDYLNCGACGNVCAAVCQSGACQACGGGLTLCGHLCRDLLNDPTFCGTTCQNAVNCGEFYWCVGGMCEAPGPPCTDCGTE